MNHKNIEKAILFTPLFLAFAWFAFTATGAIGIDKNLALGPSRIDALVNLLFSFIVIYSIVLVFVFLKMKKEAKVAPKKKSKKRKK